MADRLVTKTGKDHDGDITSLCNDGEYWSPRRKNDAIADIDAKLHSYYVRIDGARVDIKVVSGRNGRYLRTDPDKTTKNNLDDLPNC